MCMLRRTAEESHCFSTVIVTGMEKVAPWQPLDDEELMDTAPGRWTWKLLVLAGMVVESPVWLEKVTPVVVQLECPASGEIVPLPATLTSVTAYAFGLFTLRLTSPVPPG